MFFFYKVVSLPPFDCLSSYEKIMNIKKAPDFISCLHNALKLQECCKWRFRKKNRKHILRRGGGAWFRNPFRARARGLGDHLSSTPLTLKGTSIVYNPPFINVLIRPCNAYYNHFVRHCGAIYGNSQITRGRTRFSELA